MNFCHFLVLTESILLSHSCYPVKLTVPVVNWNKMLEHITAYEYSWKGAARLFFAVRSINIDFKNLLNIQFKRFFCINDS